LTAKVNADMLGDDESGLESTDVIQGAETTMTPGAAIREALNSKGWTQTDLAQILGKPLAALNEIIQGKRRITPEMAVALGSALGSQPEYWMQLDASYWLSLIEAPGDDDVARRARLFSLAPIKDMQRRGWIGDPDTTDGLESELKRFFGVPSLESEPRISASARKTDATGQFNVAQRAWAFRAKQLSQAVRVADYSEAKLKAAIRKLRRLLSWPEHARKVPGILADCGIRFVVIEPLPHTRIDGVAFWIDNASPVIAMSMRFDRIDNFWHVLGHELSHVFHKDDPVVDADIVADERPSETLDEIEKRANRESAATWIDAAEMKSFIGRVGPLYSRAKVNQFANRIRIHPGIIVGQLQSCGELQFRAFRDCLVGIREIVTGAALTDGWGHEVGI
jgi:HTH-type transcriptional regulator/antitoxin HigA